MVKKRKLRWYGRISRSSGMAKTILQGTVKGARRRGRQKKRREDNIKEWTGMEFGDSLRAPEDREGWKSFVTTSSAVPRWPPRLRDWNEMNVLLTSRDRDSFERSNQTCQFIMSIQPKGRGAYCFWCVSRRCLRCFLSALYHLNQSVDFDILLGGGKKWLDFGDLDIIFKKHFETFEFWPKSLSATYLLNQMTFWPYFTYCNVGMV